MLIWTTLLFLIGLIGLIVGLISPGKAILWGNPKQKTRKRVLFVYGIVFLVGIFASTEIADDGSEPEKQVAESQHESTEVDADHRDTDHEDLSRDEEDEKEDHDEGNKNNGERDNDTNKKDSNKEEMEHQLGNMQVHFMDVGQADAALLQYSEEGTAYNILIDSGDWTGNEAVDYLNAEDVHSLDLMVGSHPHSDHIGQMDKVMEEVEIEEVWMSGDETDSQVYERVIDSIDDEGAAYNEPRAGESYDVGPLEIDVVSPDQLHGDLNDDSIVMRVTYGDVSFMFTGDAEENAEQTMVNQQDNLDADILKVGHHGSNTSSTEAFIDSVDPDVAIMSVGEDNTYGHPDEEVVSRFDAKNIDTYATKDNGNIIVKTDGNDYDVETNQNAEVTAASSQDRTDQETSDESQENKTSKESINESSSDGCININEASEEELHEIIHIKDKRAEDVVDKRPYDSVSDLDKVDGIGESRIDDIEDEDVACVN